MATATLEEVASKPPAGVVLPPKDIRAIVEKTAGYVARNGPVFEDRIRQKEINNPKFSFLAANDAYNAYYAWRLNEVREGRGTDVSAGRVGELAANEPEKPKGPEQPPDLQFSARMPNINAKDLEIVRLTALFVAANGRQFLTALAQREAGNFQFDFLRPQHSLYQFFSRLIDQYTELLQAGTREGGKPQRERIAQLERNIKDRPHVLRRARQRAEWVRYQEQQKQQEDEAKEAEQKAYQEIDWHDFVVVETVLFNDADETAELPPPTSLGDLQSASLEQKAMMSLRPHNMRIEEAMPTDDMSYAYDTAQQHAYPAPPVQPAYSPQPPQQGYAPPPPPDAYPQESEDDSRIRARAEERDRAQQAQAAARGQGPMRIRNDYVPRAQANRRNAATALCPNCGQQIPVAELTQHMRIELLDPEWKKQKAKADSRLATTNLSTQDVANNLKRLASQRSDVFDPVTGQQLTLEEEERRKRQQQTQPVQYDGSGEQKAQLQGLNIEEQIRQIHQKFRQ